MLQKHFLSLRATLNIEQGGFGIQIAVSWSTSLISVVVVVVVAVVVEVVVAVVVVLGAVVVIAVVVK